MLCQVSRAATTRRISVWRFRRYYSSAIKPELPPSSPESPHSRLYTISTLLHSPKRLKYTTNECYSHYKGTNANLIEDLVKNKAEGESVANFVAQTYLKSKLVSALVLDLLCGLLCLNKTEICGEYLQDMSRLGLLTKRESEGNDAPVPDLESNEIFRLASILIFQAVQSGDPLLAALLVFRMNDAGIKIAASDVDMVISNLSVESPQKQTYNIYTVIRLIETFGEASVTPETFGKALLAMVPTAEAPYFANVMYDKMDTANPEYINMSRKLIAANAATGNYIRAIEIWKRVCGLDGLFAAANVGLFHKLVESVSDQKKMVVLLVENHFGEELESHPEMIHFLIKFYGQSGQRAKFDRLTRQLKPPLLRQALSLLFALFLAQNNENGAARLLKAIFNTTNGLHYVDFEAIVKKLLLLYNIQQAMGMCTDTSVSVSKLGYVRVLEFLLLHEKIGDAADMQPKEYRRKRDEFLRELVTRFGLLEKEDVALQKLTSVVFAHLSHKVNTGSCRKLYTCVAYPGNGEFDFSSRRMPQELNNLVHIDSRNRLGCVLEILRRAKWEKDADHINWCVTEMKTLGVPVIDIGKYVEET